MKPLMEVDKVIWAVDPFAERVMLQRAAAWAIQELTERNPPSSIQPVYLVNDYSTEGVSDRLVRSFVEKIEIFGNDSLTQITRQIPLPHLRPLEIISHPFQSVEQGVHALVAHAREQGGQLIVASSRAGRGGKSPFSVGGSFVEALTEISHLPILVVNPKWRHATRLPSLLFPTDLSAESFEWFLRALDFAKSVTDKITLFHKVDFPLSQSFEVASRIFPEIRNTLFRKTRESHIEAKRWAQAAKKAGVKLSVVVDSRMVGSLSESLLGCLEEHPGLVVMAPPLSTSYPKSTIQKLMKKAPFPMLFIKNIESISFGRVRQFQGARLGERRVQ